MSQPAQSSPPSAKGLPTIRRSEVSVGDRIGMGASAVVYKATWNGMPVAFKNYHPETDTSLRRELVAAGRISDHPAFVRALAVVEEDSSSQQANAVVGILLELMSGGSLATRCRQIAASKAPPFTTRQIVDIASFLARGLADAHDKGLIHADVKPENCLFASSKASRAKLADLGSAHIIATTAGATNNTAGTGMRGTPLYMAPEHAMGGALTRECDVFSFGMLCWTVLHPSDKAPLGANITNPMQIVMQLSMGKRPAIDEKTVPPEISDLIKKCWSGDANERPTMKDVVGTFLRMESSRDNSALVAQSLTSAAAAKSRPFRCLPPDYKPTGAFIDTLKNLIPPEFQAEKMVELNDTLLYQYNHLRKKYVGLTKEGALAVSAYAMEYQTDGVLNLYQELNRALATRASQKELEPLLPLIYHLHSAFSRLPLTSPQTVFRGVKNVSLSKSPIYQPERHVWWPALTSTTAEHSVMLSFAASGGTLVLIQDAQGYNIEEFSEFDEVEILLPMNAHFICQQSVPAKQASALLKLMLGDKAPSVIEADLIILKQVPPTDSDSILMTGATGEDGAEADKKEKEEADKKAKEEAIKKRGLAVVEADIAKSSNDLVSALASFKGKNASVHLKLVNPSKAKKVTCFGLTNWGPLESVIASVDLAELADVVTGSGHFFLYSCEKLTEIDLSGFNSVNSIEGHFLVGCSGLKQLDLSPLSNVNFIGEAFLYGCRELTLLDLSPLSHVTTIGSSFLSNCYRVKQLDLSPLSNVTTIGNMFLWNCYGPTQLDLSALSNVTAIGHGFLGYCRGLAQLDLSPLSSVTSIGYSFLHSCTGLTQLDMSALSQVNSIGNHFLHGCSRLTQLDLSPLSKVTDVGTHFLHECSGLTQLDLSPLLNVTVIGHNFLRECSGLKQLDLSPLSKVTTIGDWFLYGCTGLTQVDMSASEKVQDVGVGFIDGCSSLQSVKLSDALMRSKGLPESVKKLVVNRNNNNDDTDDSYSSGSATSEDKKPQKPPEKFRTLAEIERDENFQAMVDNWWPQ